ncbi:hypothetical protein BH20ACT1_BH20ACT1_09620 [soil metagenome]
MFTGMLFCFTPRRNPVRERQLCRRGSYFARRTNSFVNANRPGLDAHNSPAVVAHPDRPEVLVVADRIDTPRFSCSVSSVARNGPEYGGSRAQHPTSRPRPASMGSAAERTSGGLEASVTAPP